MKHPCKVDIVGTLADFAVNDGDEVEVGQLLCYVESMKTMFPIYAPVAGRVAFLFELGELIGEDGVVAEVETD